MSHYAIFLCSNFCKQNMLSICPLLLCPLLSLLIHKCWNIFPQVRDYSGMYTVKLVPCTAPPGVEYSFRPVCHPREPITFDLDIRFQQVITESQELIKGVTAKAQRFPLSVCVRACVWRTLWVTAYRMHILPLCKTCITEIINKTISSEMSWTNMSVWLDQSPS